MAEHAAHINAAQGGSARVVDEPRAVELLRAKYPQYADAALGPIIAVDIEQRSEWSS